MGNSEKIGLVLCSGGAKGSFEFGVWKELEILGLSDKITGFSALTTTLAHMYGSLLYMWSPPHFYVDNSIKPL